MPNSCPNCGAKLQIPNPNFCPNCGINLGEQKEKEAFISHEIDERTQSAIYELGKKMEECVAKILEARGYAIKTRERIKGISGIEHEIDVIAKKGSITKAVECKNWNKPVGKENIQKFHDTLEDLGRNWNGIFVSFAGFTEDAERLAEYYNIDRWDSDFLKEEYWATSVGRAEYATIGKSITVKNALPLRVSFSKATEIELRNKEKVKAYGMLSYHPYFVISYSYYARVKDPTKRIHTFKDSGKVFIDGLDGTVLNPPPVKGIHTISSALKTILSKEAREESRRSKILCEELENSSFIKEYNIEVREEYKVRVLQPSVGYRSVNKSALEYIIQKNTEVIEYTSKNMEDEYFPEHKRIKHTPKVRDINIKGRTLVFVPRWDITFEAVNKTYSREMLAYSGTVLEDTIRYCPKHIGFLKKENVAVCEVCGQALCDSHVFECPICGKWLCEEDGISCESCKRIYCKEHTLSKCEICGLFICNDCHLTCPICKKTFSQKHVRICSKCGRKVCVNCATSMGLLKKKILCKECQTM